MKPNRRRQGSEGEDLACQFLTNAGYEILARNYRFERGEVDIVAKDGEEIVFVEVKARRSTSFGEPEDAVDEAKQGQIANVAEGYLTKQGWEDAVVRFDVIAILYINGQPRIEHIKDAF